MDDALLILSLEALASLPRIRVLRCLAQAPQGLAAGVIAERLGMRRSTLSNHLSRLERVGLVLGRRAGKAIIYRFQHRSVRHLLNAAREATRAAPD